MKRKMNNVFDERDEKAVQLFTDLGMPKNLAKTLMYVCQVNECRSAEIEQRADLRQPEVSVAMQELRRRGWVKKRDQKKQGKGRPIHIYRSTTHLSEILEDFEREKLREVETFRNNISELKGIIQSR
jgi:predicted transcriptional regulator